jgi:hypothetical protein
MAGSASRWMWRRELRYVGDVLIDMVRVRCIPRGEGPPVEYDGDYVTELRDGKVAYWCPYLDPAEAVTAAEARAAWGVRPD